MTAFAFLFGLTVGSFLNVVIHRLNTKESVFKGRSSCPRCRHQLSWYDLLPLVSFLLLKGRCRYCRKPISLRYLAVELFSGLLFAALFTVVATTSSGPGVLQAAEILYLWAVAGLLVVVFVYDLKHTLIPDVAVYPAIALAFLWQAVAGDIVSGVLSALGAGGFFLALHVLSQGKWMGLGDVKLALFMGLFLGFPHILIALFLAFLAGAVVGVALVVPGKKTMRSEVPFGPFLVAGTFAAYFFGEVLVDYYLAIVY